jgi:hypothetical protein
MSHMCRWCAQAFHPVKRRQVTCSGVCARAARLWKLHQARHGLMCVWCAQSFTGYSWNAKLCSEQCYKACHTRQAVANHRRRHPPKRGPHWEPGPRARSQRYYVKHRARRLANNKAWRDANPEKERTRHTKYNRAHPEWVSLRNARRRIRKKNGATGELTPMEARSVIKAAQGRCAYCKRKVKKLTIDHITPIAQNGPNTVQNIVAACWPCNHKKRTGLPPVVVQPFLLV